MKKDEEELDSGDACAEHGSIWCDCDYVHPGSGKLLRETPVKVARAKDRTPEQIRHQREVGAREIKHHAGLMKRLAKCDLEQYIDARGPEFRRKVEEAMERQSS